MRLVLCDQNLILCDALAATLERRGHEVVAISTSPEVGVAAVAAHRPDAALVDPRFAGADDGLDVVRLIRQHSPETAIVILSARDDPALAGAARDLGVAGLLHKNRNVTGILAALDVIASGGTVYDSRPLGRHPRLAAPSERRGYALTPREREVLSRLVAGQGTWQMASEMNIAASTLRTYVKNLFVKLGTHSRLQAAALASGEGLQAELSA